MHPSRDVTLTFLTFAIAFLSSVRSRKEEDGSLSFMVIGDWGGQDHKPYYTDAENYCAESMGDVAKDLNSQFTIALGDNFYEDGVTDVDDKRLWETFEDVFTADSLQTRWYAVCGNHDYHGNCSAQVAYTKSSRRWTFPYFYYTQTFSVPGTSVSVQIVFIDTIILTGVTNRYNKRAVPPGPMSVLEAEREWEWIESTLQQSTADWLIVAGHYPVWSAGSHGPTPDLVERLKPMLERYNVNLYLSGHDHNLQHIKETNSTVHYIVSGAGHEISDDDHHKDDLPKDSLLLFHGRKDKDQSHGGFNSITVEKDVMNVMFYTAKAKLVYSTTISSTRKQ